MKAADLEIGDLIRLNISDEYYQEPQPIEAVVRGIGRDGDGVTLRVGHGIDYRGVGRPIERRVDLTLRPGDDIELLERQRTLAKADYRFASGGELWPVAIEIVERKGIKYLSIFEALGDHRETQFSTAAELAAMLPEREDEGEVGYLAARASLLQQYEAAR